MTTDQPPSDDAKSTSDGAANDLESTLAQTMGQLAESRDLSARSTQPPASVEGYSFIRQIGEGAYGSVWLAREDNTGKQVAIKFYTHRRGLDWSLLNREVEKLAVLYTSRNIVRLLDVGWDSDPPFYIMEYLENGSLASYLSDGPLPVNESVRITKQIANALVHAHGAGILHCDLKPANVLLDSDFEPRLCDFGQSRLSNEQDPALGTLFYMAREQADLNAVPDARWDVYALGALMYQMLTGEAPHGSAENHAKIREAGSLEDRLSAYREIIAHGPAPEKHRSVAGVDRRLADIISRCLATDPQKRYPNAQAVLDRLEYRDRSRARKPLIFLGIIGPGLLLAALAPIFIDAMKSNLRTLEEQLTKRALESDAAVATSEAHYLKTELDLRGLELIDAAKAIGEAISLKSVAASEAESKSVEDENAFKDFRELTDPEDPQPLREAFLNAINSDNKRPSWLSAVVEQHRIGNERLKSMDRGQDTSWFFTDRLGYQIWRQPYLKNDAELQDSLGKNYAYRDYFHGEGADRERELKAAKNLDASTVIPWCKQSDRKWNMSAAFVSTATKRNMVAITAPVYGADGEFLGMLGRTIELFELLSSLGANLPDDIDRGFALADESDWKLLDHRWVDDEILSRIRQSKQQVTISAREREWDRMLRELGTDSKSFFKQLKFDESVKQIATDNPSSFTLASYNDPIVKVDHPRAKKYTEYSLAAFAKVKVGNANWWVIVQESEKDALEPVEEMTSKAKRYGWLAFLVGVPIIGLLWFLVSRALNVSGGQQWPRPGEGRGGRLTGISTH